MDVGQVTLLHNRKTAKHTIVGAGRSNTKKIAWNETSEQSPDFLHSKAQSQFNVTVSDSSSRGNFMRFLCNAE